MSKLVKHPETGRPVYEDVTYRDADLGPLQEDVNVKQRELDEATAKVEEAEKAVEAAKANESKAEVALEEAKSNVESFNEIVGQPQPEAGSENQRSEVSDSGQTESTQTVQF